MIIHTHIYIYEYIYDIFTRINNSSNFKYKPFFRVEIIRRIFNTFFGGSGENQCKIFLTFVIKVLLFCNYQKDSFS